jgi:hypothetical protein
MTIFKKKMLQQNKVKDKSKKENIKIKDCEVY